jgi:hypothetical protein
MKSLFSRIVPAFGLTLLPTTIFATAITISSGETYRADNSEKVAALNRATAITIAYGGSN